MDGAAPSSASLLHVTELAAGSLTRSPGGGAVGPLFVVLAIIVVLGIVAGFVGRVCAGRHWGGDTQYDFEGWVEKRCASCIDGDVEAPAPPPPPPDKPAEAADAPPAETPPPPAEDSAAAAPPAADPPPAAEAAPPASDAPAAPSAEEAAKEKEKPAEAAPAPPPSEPVPPPPPPPPEASTGGAVPVVYEGSRIEPITLTRFYPSYTCNCHICARGGIFD